jgi:hypothetical protein
MAEVFIDEIPHLMLNNPDRPKNPRLEALLGERLRAAGFLPGPAYTHSPDGVYYHWCDKDEPGPEDEPDDIQLVIVGRMQHSPFEFAQMVGACYRVIGLGTLPAAAGAFAELVLNRGYWVVRLRTERDQWSRSQREKEAFDYACAQFPAVVARQKHPLVLQLAAPTTV